MYTTDVYESAGMGMREIAFATIGLSSLNVVMTGISVRYIFKFTACQLYIAQFTKLNIGQFPREPVYHI